jgi:hypothetical protein
MLQRISPIFVLKINGLKWYEIDDIEDLRYVGSNERSTGGA